VGEVTCRNCVTLFRMPMYGNKLLRDCLSPSLRKGMQGKSCFNFTVVEPEQQQELAMITRKGIGGFNSLKLPWA
jgi:hypothetical protein